MPTDSDFDIVDVAIPAPGPDEVLIRVLYLSIDPYMRGRISGIRTYAAPVEIGAVIEGGAVGEVVASNHPEFKVGDIVEGRVGWQQYGLSNGERLRKVDPEAAPISLALGALGMPGLTAYFGLGEVGRPEAGQTVFISSAAGAVGAVAGQMAKILGCRAVGTVGSDAKVDYAVGELGYDACINYKTTPDLAADLAAACPDGIDVYFDNVGGAALDAALQCLNLRARIIICGMISRSNRPDEPDIGLRPMRQLLNARARMEGFLVSDWTDRAPEGFAQLGAWYREGRLHVKEHVLDGIENAPAAMRVMLDGKNFGKTLVKVAERQ